MYEDENAQPNEGEGEETPEESQPENNQGEGEENVETPEAEETKPLPFNEDPKVQEYLDRQMEAREARLREDFNRQLEEAANKPPANASEDVPEWWGGDAKSYAVYQADEQAKEERIAQAAYERFAGEQRAQQQATQQANAWFEDNVKELGTAAGKALTQTEQNQLMQICFERELVDTKGRWNWKAGWDILQAQTAPAPTANDTSRNDRKELAAASTRADQGRESSAKAARSSEDFDKPENRPW